MKIWKGTGVKEVGTRAVGARRSVANPGLEGQDLEGGQVGSCGREPWVSNAWREVELPGCWAGRVPSLPHLPLYLFPPMTQDWLTRYGYLPPPHPAQAQLQSPAMLRDAIKVMQRFAQLPETGLLGRWSPPHPTPALPLHPA